MSFEKVPNFLLNLFEAEMSGNNALSYRFNSFLLDVTERQLLQNNKPLPLTPKAFDVLVYLVRRGGHLVLKDELMQAVWPDSFVDEVNLPRTVHTIRGTLGEDDNGNKFIETVPTKGYRFVAKVEQVNGNYPEPPDSGQFGKADPHAIDEPVQTKDRHHLAESGYLEKRRPRTVLILAATVILTVSASGLWIANRVGPARGIVRGGSSQTMSGDAFQHYQEGRFFMERGYEGDLEAALASFEHAIELDPNYAGAYAGKADAKTWLFWGSFKQDDVIQARTAIGKALELDVLNSYAHTSLCRVKATYDWDFKGAETECRRAIELDPSDQEAHKETAFLLNSLGREDEAMQEIDTAIALAPTSFNKRSRGVILYYSRRYDEAIEQLQQVEATDPSHYDTGRWLMNAYEMKKDHAHALETRIRQMEFEEKTPENIAQAKAAFEKDGWPGVLRTMVDPDRPNVAGASTYAQLGDKEKAFELLQKAFDRHAIMLVNSAREPRLDPLRSDPRFDAMLRGIGLE